MGKGAEDPKSSTPIRHVVERPPTSNTYLSIDLTTHSSACIANCSTRCIDLGDREWELYANLQKGAAVGCFHAIEDQTSLRTPSKTPK